MKVKVIDSLLKTGIFSYFDQILASLAGEVIMAETSFYF